MKSVRVVVVVVALLAGAAGGALAQSAKSDFPNRPLRYIVPFPPGGATDITGRIVATALSDALGKQVIADQGMQSMPLMGENFAAFIRSERAKWTKLVKDVGIEPQ